MTASPAAQLPKGGGRGPLKTAILRNVLFGWGEKASAIAATFITTPIVISALGKEAYGLWATVGQAAALMLMLDFGVANTVTRFISRNLALDERADVERVYSTAMAIFAAGALAAAVVTAVLAPFVPSLLNIADRYASDAVVIFLLCGFNVAVIFPLRVGRGLLQAHNRYDSISKLGATFAIARIVVTVYVFQYTTYGTLVAIALIQSAINLLKEGSTFLVGRRMYPGLRVSRRSVTRKDAAELFSLGGSAVLQTLSAAFTSSFQVIAVTVVLGVAAAPLYSIPSSLLRRTGPFINRLGSTFVPLASGLDAKGRITDLVRLNVKGVRYGLLMSLPFCVYVLFYGQPLLRLWLGGTGLTSGDLELMAHVLTLAVVPFALASPQIAASRSMLSATGKHWRVSIAFAISSLVGLGLSVALMKHTGLGVLGAAVGFACVYVLTGMIYYPFLICRHLQVSIAPYLRDAYAKPLVASFLLVLLCLGMDRLWPGGGALGLLLETGLFGCAALPAALYIVMFPEDRRHLLKRAGLRRASDARGARAAQEEGEDAHRPD